MTFSRTLIFVSLLSLVACQRSKPVAEVGRQELSLADYTLYARTRPLQAQKPAELLETIVDRELLAEGARREKLSEEPEIRARVAAYEREVLAQALVEKRVKASMQEAALRQRYETSRARLSVPEVHVRHIVVRFPPGDRLVTRIVAQTKINALYARVLSGEPFEAVAKSSSEDVISAPKGGDVGWVRAGQSDATFFTAAEKLKVGEVSKPVETAVGMHLLQAIEAPRTTVPTYEQVSGQLAAQAREAGQADLLEEMKRVVHVKLHVDRLPAAKGDVRP